MTTTAALNEEMSLERAEFEAWCRATFVIANLEHGPGALSDIYLDDKFSYAWMAWKGRGRVTPT